MPGEKLIVAFPIYNGERTMEQSLQCIADQDFRDFRAVIVDNKSTDRTAEIAKEFCRRDPRFELIEADEHVAGVDNFVRTIKIARERGEFFCLRACDDLSTRDYLGKLLSALETDPTKMLAVGSVERHAGDQVTYLTPKDDIFDFSTRIASGRIPRGLMFPSEWFYGIVRSHGGSEIMLRRWPELGTPWCAASYTVAEFVVRDLVVYVPEPRFHFIRGSNSESLYKVTKFKDRFLARWNYTIGCFRIRESLGPLSARAKYKLFRMFWRDARRKTGYKLFWKL